MAKKKSTKKETGLSSKALLVNVTISQWSNRKIDKDAGLSVMAKFSNTKDSGNYHKKLLPQALELEKISAISTRARKYFYEQTLPWFSDGTRILSGENYMEFAKAFKALRNEFDDSVEAFIKKYPALQKEAEKKLGKLYDKEEYPHQDDMKDRFKIDMNFSPLPDVKDFRIEISEEERKDFESKVVDVQAKGLEECWNRLHDVVNRAVERLGNNDSTFRDSLIENITEVVNILPRLNINNDPALEASRVEIKKIVGTLHGQTLRKSEPAKRDAHAKLQKAMKNMDSYMGKKK